MLITVYCFSDVQDFPQPEALQLRSPRDFETRDFSFCRFGSLASELISEDH